MFRWLKGAGVDIAPPQMLALCLIGLLGVIGCWDVYAYSIKQPGNTVSYILGSWGGEFPILPFSMGIIVGHLFWPRGPLH